jgi:hypothetical protein
MTDMPHPMPGWRKPGYEATILRSLKGAMNFRERYEREREPGDPPPGEPALTFNGMANFLHLQGMLIACLALESDTSSELLSKSAQAAQRVPAWMEMWVYGPSESSMHMFALGCAQLLVGQREALERIVEEQVEEPEPIEEALSECPIPTGEEGESTEELCARTAQAFRANFQATIAIARDLDEWLEEELRREESDGEESDGEESDGEESDGEESDGEEYCG